MSNPEETPLLSSPTSSRTEPGKTVLVFLPLALTILFLSSFILSRPTTPPILFRRSHHHHHPNGHVKNCSAADYSSTTFKTQQDVPLSKIFPHSLSKFEASDIIVDPNLQSAYVVFDNSFAIARLNRPPHASHLLRWIGRGKKNSQFEFLAYNHTSETYIVGRECTKVGNKYLATTFEVTFSQFDVHIAQTCTCDYELSHSNTGFEAAIVVEIDGESFLAALCEGNYCKGGEKGKEAGNGRIILMKKVVTKIGTCVYQTVQEIALPKEVNFQDYSAMTVVSDGMIAIASQENSAVWIGTMDVQDGTLVFGKGSIIDFPRNDKCEITYCNVEGIVFLGRHLFAVSDAMKKGKQSVRCHEKEQSIHMLEMPVE